MSKAELNKYLKELSKAERDPNKLKECAELCNYIGDLHSEKRHYEDAIYYHLKALEYSEKEGDNMGMFLANRCLGECYMATSQLKLAERHTKQYDIIVRRLEKTLENIIEMQRARFTLARLYLTQAQELSDNHAQGTEEFRKASDNAEKSFIKADEMADFLWKNFQKKLPEKEYPEMKARILLNIAIVKDLKGDIKAATQNLKNSIEICEENKLKEDLYNSQMLLASIYRQHKHQDCMKILEAAIATAKHLRSSKGKLFITDAYIEKGLVLLERKAFQKEAAMKCFYLAYEEQCRDETRCDSSLQTSIKLLKLSYLIYLNHNRLKDDGLTSIDYMEIYDTLGDCFTELEMFTTAIVYYEHALERAKSANRPSSEIAAIYTSIAESYADSEQYSKAIEYYERELKCWQPTVAERTRTLIKIAQMKESMRASSDCVIEAYTDAYKASRDNSTLEYQVLKVFVPYLSANDSGSVLHRKYARILESFPMMDDQEKEEPSIVDDIRLDDVLNEFNDEEEEGFKYLSGSARTKRTLTSKCLKKFKVDDLGQTPLHRACIAGDKKKVERLLDSNHPLNPVENSGWTPIHEAAINGHTEIVEMLIEKGAKLNLRGHNGITPLHDAALNGHFSIINILLKNKANCMALDDDGNTPLDYLIEFHKDNKNSMTNSQLEDWTQTKSSLTHAMDQAGFDFKSHMINRVIKSSAKRASNLVTPTVNREDLPTGPVQEYKSAMTDLRRPKAAENTPTGLVQEYKSAKTDLRRSKAVDDTPTSLVQEYKSAKTDLRRSKAIDDIPTVISDDEDIVFMKSRRKRLNSPVPCDDPISHYILTRDDTSSISSSSNQKKTIKVEIESSNMPILVDFNVKVQWLIDQVTERYMSFLKLTTKPTIELYADGEDFPLYEKDIVQDVVHGDLKACIKSWNLLPAVCRYKQACEDDGIKPFTQPSQLCTKLENGEKIKSMDFSYCRIPRNHVVPLIRSWKRDGFQHLNLSSSNICIDDEQSILFSDVLSSLYNLTKLSLSCCGLNNRNFAILCKSKLHKLLDIDLSYNDILCQTEDLEELSKNAPKLQTLDLRHNTNGPNREFIHQIKYKILLN